MLSFLSVFSQDVNIETDKIASTCKVWGFLKYYHPHVANGEKNWDQQLFNILPLIDKAKNGQEYSMILEKWIDSLGNVEQIVSKLIDKEVQYFDKNNDLSWIKSNTLFSKKLSQKLKVISENNYQGKPFYINFQNENINRVPLEFTNEVKYPDFNWEDKKFRILTFFRYWNYIEYFFPYKYLMDQKWDKTLTEMLPKFLNAKSEIEFHLALKELTVKTDDTHATFGTKRMLEHFGSKFFPAYIKIINDQAVITDFYNVSISTENDIRIGDVITKVNGKKISQLINENLKYVEGSNLPSKFKRVYWAILNGNENEVQIEMIRGNTILNKIVKRYLFEDLHAQYSDNKEWSLLNDNIGYINLNGLEIKGFVKAFENLKNTQAIIFDLRNYPNDIEDEIAKYLNPEPKEFARFLDADLSRPGRFIWRKPIEKCGEINPNYYKGKVVILVNEESISHSEFAIMCLQTAPDVTIVGSQTAGADGGVYRCEIIKGLKTQFSSYGVFYPDKRQTQRIGIVPDIKVEQTVLGIQQGRDEILDRAIQFIREKK